MNRFQRSNNLEFAFAPLPTPYNFSVFDDLVWCWVWHNYTELRLSIAVLVITREEATYEQYSVELAHRILKYRTV
jgi:hypothetical protein